MSGGAATLSLAGAAVLVLGCGDSDRLVVAAAASLKKPLTQCSRGFASARVRLSFAGSSELAAQIRRGVTPAVFATADERLAHELAREGLLERPRPFAGNELVLAVPADSPVREPQAAGRPGTRVAVGTPDVPVGAYARSALKRMGAAGRAILANVRTQEPDVGGIVAKLTQGAADAGLVYATDVRAARGDLRALALPEHAQPDIAYAAAVTPGAPAAARAYVDDLLRGACARALRRAGFAGAR